MELDEIVAEARRVADDTADPPQYATSFLYRVANEAEREACVRGRLIYDTSSEFLSQTVDPAALDELVLDPLIDEIDRAWFTATGSTRPCKLTICGTDWMDDRDPSRCVVGQPHRIARVGQYGLRLWPRTTVGGVLVLAVYRRPLFDMEEGDDEPEIEAKHHEGLVDWMLHKAFLTRDGEEGDKARSDGHLALFEQRFGPRPDAAAQRAFRERRRVTTRYGGL